MRRGDIVTVAAAGDYGKPRPAVIVQSDHLLGADSIIVCPLTSTERDAPLVRLPIDPSPTTGLRQRSYVMVEKVMALAAKRCGKVIGRLDDDSLLLLNQRLAFTLGLADVQG